MDKNEIKKALYKEKPVAELQLIRKGFAYYDTIVLGEVHVGFEVPVADMGDADFFPQMDAKLLIRYIVR